MAEKSHLNVQNVFAFTQQFDAVSGHPASYTLLVWTASVGHQRVMKSINYVLEIRLLLSVFNLHILILFYILIIHFNFK